MASLYLPHGDPVFQGAGVGPLHGSAVIVVHEHGRRGIEAREPIS